MDEDALKEYWASLALRHCRGLGARSVYRLLRHFGSAYAAVQGHKTWPEAGIGSNRAAELATGSWRVTAREEWDQASALDTAILLWGDSAYPSLLRSIPDAPPLLYCRGDISLLASPAVAVVGARKATPHALKVAQHMAQGLAACGIAIVSGMAQGVDRIAQETALHSVGRSIGVLGTGIDKVYPRANQSLFTDMERDGLLVSEFAPGTPPQASHFPIRNRIISGLSLGVLVVEATAHSGSLVTARLAVEQNREVYVVPGQALDPHCFGCQELVRQGAHAVFSTEDILLDMADILRTYGIRVDALSAPAETASDRHGGNTALQEKKTDHNDNAHASVASKAAARAPDDLPHVPPATPPRPSALPLISAPLQTATQQLAAAEQTTALLDYLRAHGPTLADELAVGTGLSAAAANSALVGLEMQGQVRRLPGARFEVLA